MPVTLAEFAIHIPASIQLFEKYGLNYYQNGKQSLRLACEEKGVSFKEIDLELTFVQGKQPVNNLLTLEDMNIERLIDFINGQYHADETEVLTSIHNAILELIKNGNCGDDVLLMLTAIEPQFKALMEKLIQHCKKEDELLFPYMRRLSELKRDKSTTSSSHTISFIKNPIRVLEAEHVQAATILESIKKVLNNFVVPVNVSQEYVDLMVKLHEFEMDLHIHLHIENNVLFPKLIELEEEMNNKINV